MRSLQLAFGVLALLLAGGTLGYVLLEGWPVFDALYMTVITLTTVGYLEVHPLSTAGACLHDAPGAGRHLHPLLPGRRFIRGMVSGEVARLLGRQRMERQLAELSNHMIVCGFGRMGRLVCEQFSAAGPSLRAGGAAGRAARGLPHAPRHPPARATPPRRRCCGARASIAPAALVTAAASDADNLYITMTARLLNDKLLIVARAEEEAAEKKLHARRGERGWSPPT